MTNPIEIYTLKRIQSHPEWYYTVEDFNADYGDYGITIMYRDSREVDRAITIGCPDEAIAIAEAMIELANNIKKILGKS